jgi:5-methylcytosine-specific restriction endonuclease McrA
MPHKSQAKQIKRLLKTVSSKRARTVIEHILKHGQITTEEISRYGYEHPPRAARDVREAGIPLETIRVRSSDGRSIAAYRLGDLRQVRQARLQGRQTFPKKFKDELFVLGSGKCAICAGKFEKRYLQMDHRVPYEVAGDTPDTKWGPNDYALLCGSCNRAKSWSCEHCINWQKDKLPHVCKTCYWASPEDYVHIALREIRRADVLWNENEIQDYERLKRSARQSKSPKPEHVKKIIADHLHAD